MFERFTEVARHVVVLAQEEARRFKHGYIGDEHILLGLLGEEEGLAAQVLGSFDITIERSRAQVVKLVGTGEFASPEIIPFTPRAKKLFELSFREAISLGHGYIGTEHILLGLVRQGDGIAARMLLDFDADADRIRSEVMQQIGNINYILEEVADPEGRFGRGTRAVVRRARNTAWDLNHLDIKPIHLLIALAQLHEGVIGETFKALQINPKNLRDQAAAALPVPLAPSPEKILLHPASRKVLDLAVEQANMMDRHEIRPHHLMLGLLKAADPVTTDILVGIGIDTHRAEAAVAMCILKANARS
ncbi:MAG TPA: Clp protease N-terminal domain-containing protein [Candidatus Saccharimonadia bacterium]